MTEDQKKTIRHYFENLAGNVRQALVDFEASDTVGTIVELEEAEKECARIVTALEEWSPL